MVSDVKRMSDNELLEVYSKYNKMPFRTKEEQEYIALLRSEILGRMGANKQQ